MAGYSGTLLVRKLGIKPGARLVLLGGPAGFESQLSGLPEGVTIARRAQGRGDVVLLFASSRAELGRRFPAAGRALAAGGRLWLAWPKQASGVKTDLKEGAVRELGLAAGFVDYKIAAIDERWSGLCFARRRSPTGAS